MKPNDTPPADDAGKAPTAPVIPPAPVEVDPEAVRRRAVQAQAFAEETARRKAAAEAEAKAAAAEAKPKP